MVLGPTKAFEAPEAFKTVDLRPSGRTSLGQEEHEAQKEAVGNRRRALLLHEGHQLVQEEGEAKVQDGLHPSRQAGFP